MKVYILMEESIHEEYDETDADCKRIVGVYGKLADAQEAMRIEARKVPVTPGVDDTEAFPSLVETNKCKICEERNSLGEDTAVVTEVVTWRWSVNEFDVKESGKPAHTPNMQ